MVESRVKISSIVENQLPLFVKEEFPLVEEFLSQYYISLESQGGISDILQNIDHYIKLEQLTNLVSSTTTTSSITFSDDVINVSSTSGFPESYGLLKIGNEIITYTSKTNTTFGGCIRGFSGVTSYHDSTKPDHLVFSSSEIEEHLSGTSVSNLSILFLKEFFRKVKTQFAPGFGERDLDSDLNQNLFIKQSKDFYSSKGTDQSFEILFRALYGEDVEVIKPRDYLFIPSNAQYRVTRDLVVKALDGDPLDLQNRTLYQDQDSNFPKAYGSINNIERIVRGSEEYYVISLDYDYNKDINVEGSIFGSFSIHSQTKLITPAVINSNTLDVDSTIGFPKSGSLVADLDNGTSVIINYTSKSYTQFYGCTGIDQSLESGQDLRINSYAYGYSGIGTENVVKVRVTGVLSDLQIDQNTKYHTEGSKIQVKTLGKDVNDIKANNWIFNIATTYNINKLELVDSSNFSYRITTFDNHSLFVGNEVKLIFTDGIEIFSSVSEVLNTKSFVVTGQGQLNVSRKDKVQKLIQKTDALNFPSANIYSTDIQNTYQDQDGSIYVASSSLPSYLNQPLTIQNKSVIFSGTFNGEELSIGVHGFYTGDAIFYTSVSSTNTLGISDGLYYVKKISSTSIKLARSRSNLYNGKYLSFSATVSNNQIVLNDLANQSLESQKIVRKISNPQIPNEPQLTSPGPIGILVNGVEILNYKSKDAIFYGPLEEINVLSPGSNYDVINPPVLSISDTVGTGATGYCEVEGNFEEIRVIDGGFDYVSEPIITITGGNGFGAKAKANLFEFEHFVTFSAIQNSGQVNLTSNTIGLSSYHKFRDGEKIVYKPDGQQAIGGLTTDSVYYASVQDSLSIKLHNTYNDAIAGINTIDLTSYGVGSQRILSFNLKKKISSITVYDNGSGYKNRKISVTSSGINTYSNSITAKNHGYSTGEIIKYETSGVEIGGLTSGQSYYITSIDKDSFKLSLVGSATTIGIGSAIVGVSTLSNFYFNTNQYIDFTSSGSGYHTFNYLPINVSVNGIIGVSTRTNQNFNAILQPIVRGEIKSVFLESGGENYGSEEIINFNRQPTFTLQSGTGAEVVPVISNGKIVEVLVTNPGYGYNSPPSFIISRSGTGASLTPVISNGSLSEVKVIYGGKGYELEKTTIKVVSAGSGSEFQSLTQQWTINLVERSIRSNQITDDDGFLYTGINSNYGLQYTHLYAPRKLRQTILSQKIVNGQNVYVPDLSIDLNGRETLSNSHSPIIGWAYDGNPIYGPYGYETTKGGKIKLLESGYSGVLKNNRPSTSTYPLGFFVEDYSYQGTGDLDEYNGRFCITPEFPNGVYAYFATINPSNLESSPPFQNYRKPVFPYFIGNRYKSILNEYNVLPSSNQDDLDLNEIGVFRNTIPYGLLNKNTDYEFILNPNRIKKQNSFITYASSGTIDSVGIKTGGLNYQVKDKVIFNNSNTGGQGASAEVSLIRGKTINQISVNNISIDEVEFIPTSSEGFFIGFSPSPHNLLNSDVITITGVSTFSTYLEKTYTIGVRSDTFSILTGVGTTGATGIVTYFDVIGRLEYPWIRENDILQINSEKIKVLNIEPELSRIRVLREQEGSIGTSHTVSTLLYENPRKFILNTGISSVISNYKYNRELYFNPIDAVGLGTISGVGIGTTLLFSNPGTGLTSLFIPTRSIYLPNHNLNTGDELIYSSNGGNPLSVSTTGFTSFQLTDNQIVYTAKINDNLIGIATYRVGLGSFGSFVGINSSINTDILYFTGLGSGEIHSFTTNYNNVITGEVNKNLVTVSTASTHGLQVNDNIFLECLTGVSTSYTIKYNDYHRRLVVNPKDFTAGDVDVTNDTININSHGFVSGEKVIHTATTPSGGLKNNGIYFIVKIDNNKFKLSETSYNSTLNTPICVNLTSASSGTISLINPQIIARKNQKVIFDVSDSSLSYNKNFTSYSAFEFNLYTDSKFNNIFESQIKTNVFYVIRTGRVGIDTTATVTLTLSDNIPEVLYYKLVPIDYDNNDETKLEIITDSENILDNNRLLVNNSVYSGSYTISGITTNSFSYNVVRNPEKASYLSSEAKLSYTTNSLTAFGEISNVRVTSSGRGYKFIPQVSKIISLYGNGSVLEPSSSTIGKIVSTEIQDIGFEYSADKTLRPIAKIPQIIKITSLSSFERIGISSVGKNYTIAPNLIVLDGITNDIINDVDLRYNIGDNEVTIFRNTKGINNTKPNIIPTNNSNGIGINSISFNSSTKQVTVGLAVSYSSSADYPFAVGDKVLIENTSVGVGTTSKGYNSSSYGYSLFTLISIDPNIGGANGTVTYSLENYLQPGESPGTFSAVYSSGIITPEKFFPIFDVTLKKNQFFINEEIRSLNANGIVEKWDSNNEILTVLTIDKFNPNSLIIGSSSDSQAVIEYILDYDSSYEVSSSSIVKKGWKTESGFLNNDFQRIHDSDYYQYFSYALKSKIEYEDWKDPVSSMNHTAGFKKFSDLVVESKDVNFVGISTEQNSGDFIGISDLIRVIDLNCINDFDLATEKTLIIDSNVISDEIVFKSATLQDYFESIGNRVLIIDDISNQFNSNPRPTEYSSVDLFALNLARSKKYITYVIDKRYTGERQILLVTLLHNDSQGFLNQYGRVETVGDLGSFDFNIIGSEGQLLFYPNKYQVNDYNVSLFSYDIRDTIAGIGTVNLGDSVKISSSTKTIPVGFSTTTTLVGIASTYRASKILVQYAAANQSYYEYDELTVIHDGSDVEFLEYGQLSTDTLSPIGSSGIGTYSAYLSGSNLNIDFTPNAGLGVTYYVNTLRVSIANTSSSGVGTETLNTGYLESRITSIASSTSPVANVISEYSSTYSCAYYIACLEDLTNNQQQISEIIVADDGTTPSITEFGILQTNSTIGDFDVTISGGKTQLTFTPISNAEVQVRVFQNALRTLNPTSSDSSIDLTNAAIETGYGTYEGTFSDIKRAFALNHRQLPIFRRDFVGSASTVVDTVNNLIKIPNHFFVTGEELTYNYAGAGTTQAIGISTTMITGIGTTDKLPTTVYAIKVDNSNIKLSSSAENALKTIPDVLVLSSVGIGTSHSFVSKKQNSRVLVSIDNVIQSPIVATSVTTTVANQISIIDNEIKVSGITSFFGGDLIKINNEIMKVESVGFGSTNVFLVRRPWMGTGISSHSNGDLITKVTGDYNIVDNTINFVTAPYGLVPIGTTAGSPDNVDYVGISTFSTFSGRSFIRSGIPNTSDEPYNKNYVFDDISANFTGYSTSFTLKSNKTNVTGISTDNSIILVNQIFQGPQRLGGSVSIVGDCTLKENVGITSIQFTGSISSTSYDINTANVPLGGVIVSVGSTEGFGYQPLVSAGGTAIISGLGTISSISIGNSGSGYRSGLQTVRVGIQTEDLVDTNITYIGVASISSGNIVSVSITNPGVGYTSSNPPIVIFDSPLSYSSIPLVYSSSSVPGLGTGAKANIVVGQGSSIIDFEITNTGYGYGQGDILTIGIGGTVGIPTNTSIPYKEFQITIDRTYSDSFSGWSLGNLLVLDPFDSLFDGTTTSFQISLNGLPKSIRAKSGSNIDVQATLLIFINDVLQVPGKGYVFNGGSFITFTEPPKVGDTSKILFYQGTSSVDVLDVDILETIKVGDTVRLNDDEIAYKEDERLVTAVNSIDTINTNPYAGPGITANESYVRPLIWCKQTNDLFINQKPITKDRTWYEPLIYPSTRIIQTVGVGSTVIFVESVKTFFDSSKENSTKQNKIRIISQNSVAGASATAIVSAAGTITSVSITSGGIGYTFAPSVTFANPVGLGSTQRATATSSVTSGVVTSITVTTPGVGYTITNPPVVLIEEPKSSGYVEDISSVTYSGDFGIISGVSTVSVGVASTGIVFDLLIPKDSFLRDSSIVGTSLTVSGIQTGYYFVVYNSNVGSGVTSLRQDGSVVSIGTSFLDNVYEVSSVSIAQTDAVGFGVTYVAKVTVSVKNYNGLVGTGYSNFFGEYSWGRISTPTRINPREFEYYNNGLIGVSTSPIVERYNPLKYLNYN